MTLTNAALVTLWLGASVYAVFGGADFGGGFWDLLAGNSEDGAPVRDRIEKSIGPVWEANHVWLIFALVVTWTCFPPAFAAIASTLYIPATLVAFGVILRGSGFAFRKQATSRRYERLFGIWFALSSVVTPFALGTIAGAIASGRVPAGIASGDVITSWINPTSLIGGLIAICVCAYIAAVFLCQDCHRDGQVELADAFRRRAIVVAIVVAGLGLVSIPIIAADSPKLFVGLTHQGLPVIALGALAAAGSTVLLLKRKFLLVRGAAGLAVVSAVSTWGLSQYPDLLPGHLSAAAAAAPSATLAVALIGLGIGGVLVVPSLAMLFRISQRRQPES